MPYSIVNYSEVNSIFDFRIDAEYWHPKYLRAEKYLSSKGVPVKPYLNKIRCGPFGATIKCETYLEDGVIVARPFNINNYQFELNNLAYISHEDCKSKGLDLYKDGDILFSRVGDVKVGIVPDTDKAITISPNIIAISVKKELLNPYYCCAFFNSKFGLPQIQRGLKVVAQPTISTELIRQLFIIILSSEFQNKVQDLFLHSLEIKKESENFYTQAQILLLSELGLTNWQPQHWLTFVKNYSDTEQAGRIDAEYYQSKYEEIVDAIKNYSGGWGRLVCLVDLKNENFRPADKTEYKYIELANIAGNGEITGCMIEQGQDLPSRARRKVATKDVIVSSIEGSLDSIALIDEEYDQALCSTGFHVVNSQAFNSETLLVLLKSIVGQLQFKKGCSGTILTAINKDEFSKVILPIITEEKQAQIQQKVVESFNLRKQSKHLLECAKRAVEIAIEQDEQTAIDWLENRTKEIEL